MHLFLFLLLKSPFILQAVTDNISVLGNSLEGVGAFTSLSTKTDPTDLSILLLDDEKFELCCINPGLILGPVLHGSSCTSIEVLVFQYI